jgi:hypothetical protein
MVVQSFIFFSKGACSIMHASANTLTTHPDHLKYAYVSELSECEALSLEVLAWEKL